MNNEQQKRKNELIQRLIEAKADQKLIDLYNDNFERMHFETDEDFQDWEEALMLDIDNHHQKMSPSRQGNIGGVGGYNGDSPSPEVATYLEQQAEREANIHYSTMTTTTSANQDGASPIIMG